jgi:hypothetical protein
LFHRQFVGSESWLRSVFKPFNLASEMNYAVWWSGICLFVAAIQFYRCRSSNHNSSRNTAWIILSIFSIGLAIDEIGSFHEKIIKEFGFKGLLPIALVAGAGIIYSIVNLYRSALTRMSAVLVSLAILCFFAVAGLELVENSINLDSSLLKPIRLIVEEAMELTGTTFLIFAGLIAVSLPENESPKLVNLVGSWSGWAHLNQLVLALFAMHLLFFFGTLNTDAWSFRAGNPISIFPITIFFMVSLRCLYLSKNTTGNFHFLFLVLAIFLLLSSIGQTQNFALYIGRLGDEHPTFLVEDAWSWAVSLTPFVFLVLILLGRKIASVFVVLVSVIAVLAMMIWAFNASPRIATYYLYSGTVAFACFILTGVAYPGSTNRAEP